MAAFQRVLLFALFVVTLGSNIIVNDLIIPIDQDENQEAYVEIEADGFLRDDGDTGVISGEYMAVLKTAVYSNKATQSLIVRLETDFTIATLKKFVVGSMTSLWLAGSKGDVMLAAETLPEIEYVEPNQRVFVSQDSMCNEQETTNTWGLDRLDQRAAVTSNVTGVYAHSTGDDGQGVDVYILDTGIRVDHEEFNGRAVWGYTASDVTDGDVDGNGHGTHVAGTVGSQTYGVAKNTVLTAVKVLDNYGAGSTAGIVDALQWVLSDHAAKEQTQGKKPKAVLNLSLGMNGTSVAMEDAVSNVITQGLSVVVAAGNSYMNACDYSPARVPTAITVGASDYQDKAAGFTNWGTCLDVFAPGVDIVSTYIQSSTGLAIASGTSMAAPHVTGVVARYLSAQSSAPTPADVTTWITEQATSRALFLNGADEMSSPNKLLYVECYYGNGSDRNMVAANIITILLLFSVYINVNYEY